ncbi:MAG: hypothetical protein ACLTTU_13540 [Bilophila wadsworthia]
MLADYAEVSRVPFPHGGRTQRPNGYADYACRAFGVRLGERLDAAVDETEKEAATVKTAS